METTNPARQSEPWDMAQAQILGAMLTDPACAPLVLTEMREEDFSIAGRGGGLNREIFKAIRELTGQGRPVELITVAEQMIGQGGWNEKSTGDYLVELRRTTPTSANVGEYIRICKEQARLALLRQCGAEMSGAATLDAARQALNRAAGVSMETGSKTGWTAGECVTEWTEALGRGEPLDYLRTGMAFLDDTLMATPENFIVLGGYTGNGKTALAQQMMTEIAKGRHVGFFSFEMSRKQLTERMIARISGVGFPKVQRRKLDQEELRRCTRAAGEIYKLDFKIEEASGMTVQDIRDKTLREGYEVVFVDYIQLVEGAEAKWDDLRRVGETSRGLKALSMSGQGRVVYGLSQLRRPQNQTAGEYVPPPRLRDLRESGQIEQDADAVVFVHAPFPKTELRFRVIDAAKNRKDRPQSFYATFTGAAMEFRAPTKYEAEHYDKIMPKGKKREDAE